MFIVLSIKYDGLLKLDVPVLDTWTEIMSHKKGLGFNCITLDMSIFSRNL